VSLSSDGSRVAIGAFGNDEGGSNRGHVRIYDWDGQSATWVQTGADIDGTQNNGQSGFSVSLSGDGSHVAIGGHTFDGPGKVDSGHVRIFQYNDSAWIQVGSEIIGEATKDYSGQTVSISNNGNRVAIGAVLNDGNGTTSSGHVRIYQWDENNSTWEQVGDDIDGEAADDQSGTSVSLSGDGNRVAIGARFNDGNGSNSGHVRIYDWDGSTWTQAGSDIDG